MKIPVRFAERVDADRARAIVTGMFDAVRARGGSITFEKAALFRGWVMRAEMNGFKHDAAIYDNDFGGFLTAVQEMGAFFAHRLGRLSHDEAQRHLTRDIAPGSKPS